MENETRNASKRAQQELRQAELDAHLYARQRRPNAHAPAPQTRSISVLTTSPQCSQMNERRSMRGYCVTPSVLTTVCRSEREFCVVPAADMMAINSFVSP